jgi:hypothetical protein
MRGLRRPAQGGLRRLCLGLALGLCLAPAAAEETRLSLEAARRAAAGFLAEGRPEAALTLADGVLLGAPESATARMLRARALRDLGRNAEAVQAAGAAWRVAETPKDRFYAAMIQAQARSSNGDRALAQFWLRRAAQIAPDEASRAIAVRDFRHVRGLTPWRLALDLRVEPSDNLNGAPKSNTFTFAGLPFVNPGAVPLSGVRYGLGADYLYRVGLAPNRRLSFGVAADVSRVRFSQEAKDRVPGVDAGDYREEDLRLKIGYEARAEDGRWLVQAAVSTQRSWLAGGLLSDAARLDLSYGRAVAAGVILSGRLGLENETRHDVSLLDSQTRDYGLTLSRDVGQGLLRLDLAYADTASDSRSVARESRRAVLSYALAEPVKGMMPRLSLSYQSVDYDRGPTSFWIDPREDRQWGLALDVMLPDLDYYGFAPELGVSFHDRQSNYSIYETRGTDLRLGLRSVF